VRVNLNQQKEKALEKKKGHDIFTSWSKPMQGEADQTAGGVKGHNHKKKFEIRSSCREDERNNTPKKNTCRSAKNKQEKRERRTGMGICVIVT